MKFNRYIYNIRFHVKKLLTLTFCISFFVNANAMSIFDLSIIWATVTALGNKVSKLTEQVNNIVTPVSGACSQSLNARQVSNAPLLLGALGLGVGIYSTWELYKQNKLIDNQNEQIALFKSYYETLNQKLGSITAAQTVEAETATYRHEQIRKLHEAQLKNQQMLLQQMQDSKIENNAFHGQMLAQIEGAHNQMALTLNEVSLQVQENSENIDQKFKRLREKLQELDFNIKTKLKELMKTGQAIDTRFDHVCFEQANQIEEFRAGVTQQFDMIAQNQDKTVDALQCFAQNFEQTNQLGIPDHNENAIEFRSSRPRSKSLTL